MQCRRGDVLCYALKYIKSFSSYCRRKSYSQIASGSALIVSNAAHLARIVKHKHDDDLYMAKIILLIVSIILEVGIAILLFVKERYNIDDEGDHRVMNVLNDVAVFLIFGSVLVHIFVSVFVEDPYISPEMLASYNNYTRSLKPS